MKAPIFILGSHKSGTSLLRSLLDGHKQLYCYPKETHFFQYGGYWVDYALRRSFPGLEPQDLELRFLSYLEEHNSGTDPYSDSPDFRGYDKERFLARFRASDLSSPRLQAEAYFHSLYFSLTGMELPADTRIVEKSVENGEYAPVLRSLFPDCRFIHIVRNPYATLVALRKMKSGRKYPLLGKLYFSLYNSYYHLFKNRFLDRYLVLRYEDLVSQTERVMREVAAFVEIPFSESLLLPTSEGKAWQGNSTSNVKFDAVSTAPLEKWKKEIYPFEIHLVNKFCRPVAAAYDYPLLTPSRSPWTPMQGEKWKTYLKNRALFKVV